MFDWMLTLDGWLSLATLTILEIVLGVDNLVFLTIAAQKLPAHRRPMAQRVGLLGALGLRILMLSALVWLTHLTRPVFDAFGFGFSWRDIILILGGLFLLYKGTTEIHDDLDGGQHGESQRSGAAGLFGVIVMIMVIDAVFALDSVITAVGMTSELPVMIAANVVAIALMMAAAKPIGGFIGRHPTVKMLALAFILLIGMALVADGFHQHIPREYIYFAIAFSMAVESLNLIAKARRDAREERDG